MKLLMTCRYIVEATDTVKEIEKSIGIAVYGAVNGLFNIFFYFEENNLIEVNFWYSAGNITIVEAVVESLHSRGMLALFSSQRLK